MDSERPAAGEKELSQEPEQELELEILPAMHVSLFSYAEAAKRFSISSSVQPRVSTQHEWTKRHESALNAA